MFHLSRRVSALIMALAFIAGGILIAVLGFSRNAARGDMLETTAVIKAINSDYSGDEVNHTVVITYTVDGTEYTENFSEYNSSMYEGQELQILYNPNAPRETQSASATGVWIMIGAGILFALIGLGLGFRGLFGRV